MKSTSARAWPGSHWTTRGSIGGSPSPTNRTRVTSRVSSPPQRASFTVTCPDPSSPSERINPRSGSMDTIWVFAMLRCAAGAASSVAEIVSPARSAGNTASRRAEPLRNSLSR